MSESKEPQREPASPPSIAARDPGPLYRITLLSYGCFFGAILGRNATFGDWFRLIAGLVMLVTMVLNLSRYLARKRNPEIASQG